MSAIDQRLTNSIRDFVVSETESGARLPDARRFLASDDGARIVRLWNLHHIGRRIQAIVKELAEPLPERDLFQMVFPGFRDLGERLPVRNGSIALAEATVPMLHESARIIRADAQKRRELRASAKADRIDALAGNMAAWAREHDIADLTAEVYWELAAKTAKKAAKKAG